MVPCCQKWYHNDNMLPKLVKNDNKIVKYCKNGKMLTKMVTKC